MHTCLQSFCSQINGYESLIEILVSDNCSTDNTQQVVEAFMNNGYPISYNKNKANLGPDANMQQLLQMQQAKYFWLFGDDDLLLDGMLFKIMNLLQNQNYNMLYLSNYWFNDDYIKEAPKPQSFAITNYTNPNDFIKKINIWITFISAGIFSTDVLQKINLNEFQKTNLYQLGWVLPSIYQNGINGYVAGNIIACKAGNTGGYGLFKTFGINLKNILDVLQQRGSISPQCQPIVMHYFIKDFMPLYYIRFKQGKMGEFSETEKPFNMLRPIYKSYFIYWVVLFPIEILPVSIGKKYYYGLKKVKLI